MKKLTEKQHEILRFIADFINREGMSPTVYEIGEAFNLKPSTIFIHLRSLQQKKYITRTAKARSIRLLQLSGTEDAESAEVHNLYHGFAAVPLIENPLPSNTATPGRIRSDLIVVSRELLSKGNYGEIFAFPVGTNALQNCGIQLGDLAFAQLPRNNPANGDIVLLYDGKESVLGVFYRWENGQIELRNSQLNGASAYYSPGEVSILGVVIALQRKF